MSEDTSRRDHTEQRLKATEERFRITQVAGGIGWFEWDLTSDKWEWTPHVAALFGFDPETPRPAFADWQPAIFIDDVPKLRLAIEQAGEKGPYYVEFRVTHSDGSVHWIAGKGEITRDAAGRALQVAGVYYDISDRKALEARMLALNEGLEARVAERARQLATTAARLEETERRFQLLIDAVTDYAIFMLDKTGNVVSWNPGAERIKGYSAGEIIGQHFSRFYTDARPPGGGAADCARDGGAHRKIRGRGHPCSQGWQHIHRECRPQCYSRSVCQPIGLCEDHPRHHAKEGSRRSTPAGPKDGGCWASNRRGCS